jgi:hypothetical protein
MNIYCLIRDKPWYRRDAFRQGALAAGHSFIAGQMPKNIDQETVLLIWNRYGEGHRCALEVERRGGIVLVAENGYYGEGGTSPKFDVYPDGPKPNHYYALSCGYHNDDTRIPRNHWMGSRLAKLGLWLDDLPAFRVGGDYVLVCPNRSFGVPGRMMDPRWCDKIVPKLRQHSSVPVVVRDHPGNEPPKKPLGEDLKGAGMVVIWSSSVGVHALVQGIPVVCCAPYWVCKTGSIDESELFSGAVTTGDDLYRLRAAALSNMSCLQWTCEEIADGTAFRNLLPGG